MREAEQVLITCAVLSDIPEELGAYHIVTVSPGAAGYAGEQNLSDGKTHE